MDTRLSAKILETLKLISNFCKREKITWLILFQPVRIFRLLYKYRFLHYLLVGGGGALLNLLVTWSLTTFWFGIDKYFSAYLFGLTANLIFTFTLYSVKVFNTSKTHINRLAIYLAYVFVIVWLQAEIVKNVVPLVGLEFYLGVITVTLGSFALINFFVYKFFIFRERKLLN